MLFVSKPEADNFALNYLNYMPKCKRYIGRGMDQIRNEIIKEEDIVWLEWANDLTAQITEHKWIPKIMVRVHDHEITQNRIMAVNWDNVDYIWFINRQAQKDFNAKIKVNCKQFFLPNAFDPKPFTPNYITNKHIGVLSIYCKPRKRIDRAIRVFRELYAKDEEWQMTIRLDPFGFTTEYDKCRALSKDLPIKWDIHSIDMATYGADRSQVNEFFQDKAIVLSTSDHEGFHYAIAEGVACGCYPVVYEWEWGYAKDHWGIYATKRLYENLEWFGNLKPEEKIKHQKMAMDSLIKFNHPSALIPRLHEEINK